VFVYVDGLVETTRTKEGGAWDERFGSTGRRPQHGAYPDSGAGIHFQFLHRRGPAAGIDTQFRAPRDRFEVRQNLRALSPKLVAFV